MLKKIYLGGGALLIAGYLGWSLFGFETGSQSRERVPTVKASRSHSSGGRSRMGYYGGGSGFGFGK